MVIFLIKWLLILKFFIFFATSWKIAIEHSLRCIDLFRNFNICTVGDEPKFDPFRWLEVRLGLRGSWKLSPLTWILIECEILRINSEPKHFFTIEALFLKVKLIMLTIIRTCNTFWCSAEQKQTRKQKKIHQVDSGLFKLKQNKGSRELLKTLTLAKIATWVHNNWKVIVSISAKTYLWYRRKFYVSARLSA